MTHYAYLASLLFFFGGLLFADLRFGDGITKQPLVWLSVVSTAATLLIADLIGIHLSIFSTNPKFVVGLFLGSRNLPVEEPIFLLFLSFFSALLSAYTPIKNHNA